MSEKKDLFWSKVSKTDGCWLWTAGKARGYGVFGVNSKQHSAHRLAYEELVGNIPKGMVIDHTCHNKDLNCNKGQDCPHRACVNPSHLELTTQKINCQRGRTGEWFGLIQKAKTHCKHGHEYSPENTYNRPPTKLMPRGARGCKTCQFRATAKYKKRIAVYA